MVKATTSNGGKSSLYRHNGPGYDPHQWYQRYSNYPDYCSTPKAMQDRQIPPLREWDPSVGETRLVHVTAIIRHGARTPWTSGEQCWNGYWNESSDTSRWDCDLTTITAPPDPNTVHEEEGDTASAWLPEDTFFLFEKKYDALFSTSNRDQTEDGEDDGPSPLKNELNGTCQVGQMLLRGYDQQIENGNQLREAYGYYKNDYFGLGHDERMRLIDLSYEKATLESVHSGNHDTTNAGSAKSYPWDDKHLYFRADDDQRTVMSGQVLLRGLFDNLIMRKYLADETYPNVVVHTADRVQDVLDANAHVCPRLEDLRQAALNSSEYQAFNTSDEIEAARWFARDKLGNVDVTRILDCLMTTICTDRTIPDSLDDEEFPFDEPESMFRKLAQMDIQSYNLVVKYNNSAYAKLAMAPLWAEIMEQINPWLVQNPDPDATPGPKLALFSGHDTTIMPLLASIDPALWDDSEWPPYASMMLIEIHELIDGISDRSVFKNDFAFRLLYNGRILTHLVPGCEKNAELCDVAHFKAIVDPMARRDVDCSSSLPPLIAPPLVVMEQARTLINTTQGMLMFLGLVIFGMAVGAVATYVLLTGRLPYFKRQILKSTEVEDDYEARQGLQSRSNYDDSDYGGNSNNLTVEANEPSDEENEDGFVEAGGRFT